MNFIGKEINRVDGPAKVKGEAKYAAEFMTEDLLYGVVVSSTVAKGKIRSIDFSEAEKISGVVKVLTHKNRPHVSWFNKNYKDDDAPKGRHMRPLYDDKILYSGQPVALVVAKNFEAARAASALICIDYESETSKTDLRVERKNSYKPGKDKSGYEPPPKPKGDAEKVWKEAQYKMRAEYYCPPEHHNPMEPHASTVVVKDGKYIVYDKTQGVANSKTYVCSAFGLSDKDVQVVSPFVGGAFGSGLRPQYQLFLAMLAAVDLKRSVRVSLTRQQMFTFGHRPNTIQEVALSADKSGKLLSLEHKAIGETSTFENYVEDVVTWGPILYEVPNVLNEHEIADLDVYTPLDMRAPGAAWGVNILEMAMDELSYVLKMDPLDLRLKNYTDKDEKSDKPFSSKELKKCYEEGARKFGWEKRNPSPRSMKKEDKLIGYGMGTGVWQAEQKKASAKVIITKDGKAEIQSATSDIGTGTYTIITQVGAQTLGLKLEDVTFKLGDTDFPDAPLQGGSWTAASIGAAVEETCIKAKEELVKLLPKLKDSPLTKLSLDDLHFENGIISRKTDHSQKISISNLLEQTDQDKVEVEASKAPDPKNEKKYSRMTHSAYFVEVEVDEDLGTVKVNRVVAGVAAGKILNPKTARSQVLGGVVWGISMALHEESLMDHTLGRYMNHNLAEYHIPVNADIHDIDVIFVKEEDEVVNPLGVKGLGEIGIVGVAAAVANAIYHATGKRVRDLPITLDKIM